MKSDKLYIDHILESIDKIGRFVAGLNYAAFRKNELAQSAVMRELEIIGEASKKLSEKFKKSYGNVPWKEIMGMRDKLAHDYFEIDIRGVWKTATEDIPELRDELGSNK